MQEEFDNLEHVDAWEQFLAAKKQADERAQIPPPLQLPKGPGAILSGSELRALKFDPGLCEEAKSCQPLELAKEYPANERPEFFLRSLFRDGEAISLVASGLGRATVTVAEGTRLTGFAALQPNPLSLDEPAPRHYAVFSFSNDWNRFAGPKAACLSRSAAPVMVVINVAVGRWECWFDVNQKTAEETAELARTAIKLEGHICDLPRLPGASVTNPCGQAFQQLHAAGILKDPSGFKLHNFVAYWQPPVLPNDRRLPEVPPKGRRA